MFYCLLLAGCAAETRVPQASYNINKIERVADKQGWYQFAGFDYKGRLLGGNPHGKGRCRPHRDSLAPLINGQYPQIKDTACEFDHGERIDQSYIQATGQQIDENEAYRKEEVREAARERARQEDARREAAREQAREDARANAAALAQMQRSGSASTSGSGFTPGWYADVNKIHNKSMDEINQTVKENRERKEAQRRADAAAAAERREQENERRTRENERRQSNVNRSTAQYASPYSTSAAQPQPQNRKELQAQMAAKQQAHNKYEEDRQRQAQQQARENTQSRRQPQQASESTTSDTTGSSKKKVKYGPEQLEGIAVCWQSKKNNDTWWCDGPTQYTEMGESLQAQLGYAGCKSYRATDGSREITLKSGTTVTATVYLCGYGLWTDRDVAKKYGITVQRNKYQCVNGPKTHCTENFQMTY